MATLLTRMFSRPRAFCTACQVGQGRNCSCRAKHKPRRELTVTEATWLVIVLDVACLVAVAWLVLGGKS